MSKGNGNKGIGTGGHNCLKQADFYTLCKIVEADRAMLAKDNPLFSKLSSRYSDIMQKDVTETNVRSALKATGLIYKQPRTYSCKSVLQTQIEDLTDRVKVLEELMK